MKRSHKPRFSPLSHSVRHLRAIPSGLVAILFLAGISARADYASLVSGFGPLGYWRFNETNASPALNQVANSSSLGSTANGNIVMDADKGEAGIVGSAVRFHNPGTTISYCGSKIDVPYQAAINPDPPFTIEFWAKPATLVNDANGLCPLSSLNPHFSANNRSGWLFYVNNIGQWQFRLGSENMYVAVLPSSGGNASPGVWQHVVGSYDGTMARLYINGSQVGSVTLSAAANAAFRRNTQTVLRIGGTTLGGRLSSGPVITGVDSSGYRAGLAGNRGFDGWVDEVAVYASALSPTTIAAHHAAATTNNAGYGTQILAANPVGYWNLNEPVVRPPSPGSFPVALNSGSLGSAADGTNVWGVLAAQAGPAGAGFGAENRACYFNGASGYLALGNPAGLNFSNQITLLAWIKPQVKDFFRSILAHGWDGGRQETFLRISRGAANGGYGDGNYYEVGATDGSTFYDAAYFPMPEGDLGNWVFLAGTDDGTNWNLYRNGVLVASLPSTRGARTLASRWSVGSRSDPSEAEGTFFGGYMDEPAIFSTALSPANLTALYSAAQVPPMITRAPQLPPGVVYEGASVILSVWADGSPTLGYQWTRNGAPLPGQTGTNLALNGLLTSSNGTYAVVVTNAYGAVTSAVSLIVVSNRPLITQPPQPVTNYEGRPANFAVVAEGSLPLSFQWRQDSADISGATNSSYSIASLTFGDAGEYSVRITNALGGTNSPAVTLTVLPAPVLPDGEVQLTGVPDYNWYAGCFGTASGILMGYWDRHGLPDFYTGPTAGGVAPLDNCGNNIGIRALWATKAGLDGRPADLPGHIEDYWAAYTISLESCGARDSFSYENTQDDPYKLANRPEHVADCIGDFIGVNQKKWTNMNNECDGNIDAFSFVFWDLNGSRRVNYIPPPQGPNAVPDIPSGLREWTRWRGYDAEVFSQLVDFNPHCPPGQGFTFGDLRAEIDAGYPVLVFLQNYNQTYRSITNPTSMPKANPDIHGMLVYGYQAYGAPFSFTNVYCRTSWGSGDDITYNWAPTPWVLNGGLSVRGVIGFRPRPRIRSLSLKGPEVTITWDGPASQLYDVIKGTLTPVHTYQVERSPTLDPPAFAPVGPPTTNLNLTIPDCCDGPVFYRVQLLAQ